MYDYLPFGPYDTVEDLVDELFEARIRRSPDMVAFAVFDKTRAPTTANGDAPIAGVLGFLNSSARNLSTEIGFVMILPPFQRTHVASNAVGLLLHYCLDLPSAGGLGLRRVMWQANALNVGSVKAAERMGFKHEALLRWDRVLPKGKEMAGNRVEGRKGDPMEGCVGRDTVMLSLCWDDWEAGDKERVDAAMARTM